MAVSVHYQNEWYEADIPNLSIKASLALHTQKQHGDGENKGTSADETWKWNPEH